MTTAEGQNIDGPTKPPVHHMLHYPTTRDLIQLTATEHNMDFFHRILNSEHFQELKLVEVQYLSKCTHLE